MAVQRQAHFLDKNFHIGDMGFGWAFIINIMLGAGDVACAALNYVLLVRKACEADLPPSLILFNNALSAIGGVVPVVEGIVIAMYKAHSRNAMLLEEFLRVRGEQLLSLQAEGDEVRSGPSTSHISQTEMEQVKPGAGKESLRRSSQRSRQPATEDDLSNT